MTFVSYAQNFEDVLLWRALQGIRGGFYIDVGAAHPDTDSVTRAFYDRGWNGINVEPTRENWLRLSAARPHDINLQFVLGERPGSADLFIVDGTGLSTVDAGAATRLTQAGMEVRREQHPVDTLAAICASHAQAVIHFLKIDVEGAERAVLSGADFALYRPWIVVIEATAPLSTTEMHAEWEPILLAADYRFVWFDGLNRFYVAAEQAEDLAGSFRTPPNVWDDFIRAADSEFARRISVAETRATDLLERAVEAETRASREAAAAAQAQALADQRGQELIRLRCALADQQQQQARASEVARVAEERVRIGEDRRHAAEAWLDAMRASTSWRVTAPLRRLRSNADPARPKLPDLPPATAPSSGESPLELEAPPPRLPPPIRGQHRKTVHQFHSGSAVSDAITNAMLRTQTILRELGYESDIFVEHRDPLLAGTLRLFDELPRHDRYVLIVRHSMGFDGFARVASLAAPKILIYHNITPAALLADNPHLQRYAELGRRQLAAWRDQVSAALADSEYNALELLTLGFRPVQVCTLLFDVEALLAKAKAREPAARDEVFTILFVGRVCEAKGQSKLVEAYLAFRAAFAGPSRLVLVGRNGGDDDPYTRGIRQRAAALGVEKDIILTGLVSDDELHGWYLAADLYVSMSWHEGFGVPLVEAMAHDVPVLARPSGAVPFTLGDTDCLLESDEPRAVAARMLALAGDADLREKLGRSQRATLARFAQPRQSEILLRALMLAGAAPPPQEQTRRLLSANMRVAIAGHVNGSYSLAAINRDLALQLEAEHAGSVRLLPVEGAPTDALSAVPAGDRAAIATLAARTRPQTGPELVISQHYPVYKPHERGDLTVALVFWEESLLPAETVRLLDQSFDAVLSPSRFVAKALIDSGVSIPVRTVGFAPRVDAFRQLGEERAARTGGDFVFLHVSSCFPRKGIDVLLRAYARAFRRDDPVKLVIKGFPNPHNDAAEQITRLREQDADAPAIELIDRDLSTDDLIALYRGADAIVLPSRGEGFNLPAAEALAARIPLIVTGYGGHMDFVHGTSVRLVDYSFAAARTHLATPTSVWAEPDEADLASALRETLGGEIPARPVLPDAAGFARHLRDIATDLLMADASGRVDMVWVSSWNVRCGIAEYSRQLIEALPTESRMGSIAVLCDHRTQPDPPPMGRVTVIPCWELGLSEGARELTRAVAVEDPGIVVIQHQPGLFGWSALAELLASSAVAGRVVVVTLHATSRILDVPAPERRAALAALAAISRVVVHTIADLNQLKALGLIENVVLVPHGAPPPGPAAHATRALAPTSFPLIGCYGFMLPGKGIPQLITALALLRESMPTVRLRLVNADYGTPESEAEIAASRAAAESLGVADAIEWHTAFLPHERSLALLAECDVVALPYQSSKEASSAALRSAMAAGAPLAVTPIPLFDEAEDAVFRLPGTDGPALAAGLHRLLMDVPERARLHHAAQLWLRQRAWPVIAERTHGMLLGLDAARAVPSVPVLRESPSCA